MRIKRLFAPLKPYQQGRKYRHQQRRNNVKQSLISPVQRGCDGAQLFGIEVFGTADAVAAYDKIAVCRHYICLHGIVVPRRAYGGQSYVNIPLEYFIFRKNEVYGIVSIIAAERDAVAGRVVIVIYRNLRRGKKYLGVVGKCNGIIVRGVLNRLAVELTSVDKRNKVIVCFAVYIRRAMREVDIKRIRLIVVHIYHYSLIGHDKAPVCFVDLDVVGVEFTEYPESIELIGL